MARATLADFTAEEIKRYGLKQSDLDRANAIDQHYLDQPAKEIDVERWDDMLGVLPPEHWHSTPEGINVFFMAEYTTGNITNMFGRFNGKYMEKYVDRFDKETWLCMKDFVGA